MAADEAARGGGAGRWGGENFSLAVARIKRLIVKATCAREPAGRPGGEGAGGEVAVGGDAASAIGARWVGRR